jgi:hypothetical protein
MSDYDTDILEWSEQQAALLRRRAAGELVNEAELDWPNIAEEIESLGKAASRELANRISTILIHLMKLAASPAIGPHIGWFETIREQRDELERLLKDAPSLRRTVPAVIDEETGRARKRVRAALADYDEQPRADIDSLTFAEDQVLGEWFPG